MKTWDANQGRLTDFLNDMDDLETDFVGLETDVDHRDPLLAILELGRHHGVRTEQDDSHGEIWVVPGESFASEFHAAGTDSYEGRIVPSQEMPLDLK